MTETDKDDLVVRLRLGGKVRADGGYSIPSEQETMQEAADEIERLRLQLAKAKAENEEMVRVCDSYAAENQRLFDRAENATTQLAKARSAFDAAVATTTGNDFNTALVELCHILADDVGNSEEAND